tara:strand:+ start:468 stop:698 length:231 start_codon:yes stop_codon:yes gene_type:complete
MLKEHLEELNNILERINLDTQIIAGSIRTQQDVCDAWDYGADIVTTGLPVINEMIHHPKTNESYDGFMKDFAAWIK